jgi:hypothetical protein
VPEDLEDTIPNIVLKGFRQTVVSKGKVVLRIQVDRAEGFEREETNGLSAGEIFRVRRGG